MIGERMKQLLLRISSLSLIVFILSLIVTIPARAIPSLPSSFYGMVKINGVNVPDGTVVQALIGGQVYAEVYTQTYQGNSVYALDVRGDDSETAAQDGGREGDAIQFKVGGTSADQTAVWRAGTNVSLDLTASSSGPIPTPQATPTPVPTQTAIVLIQPSFAPAATGQASSTSAIPVQPSSIATKVSQPSSIATKETQPSPMPTRHITQPPRSTASSGNDKDTGSGAVSRVMTIIITFALAMVAGYRFLTSRRNGM